MQDEKKDYVIDVVKERSYQNQSGEYNRVYSKWRADEKNQYAYRFVHDVRENSYVAGEGFLDKRADTAESVALYKCLGLLGVVMLVILGLDVLLFFISSQISQYFTAAAVYRSNIYDVQSEISIGEMMIFYVINIIKYVIAFIILKVFTKIPMKVALPRQHCDWRLLVNSICLMMMIMIIGRIGGYLLSNLLKLIHIDSVYTYMFIGGNFQETIISMFFTVIVFPVLCEMLFRGIILQLFRQFGDSFAILISSVVCAFTYYDFGYILYALFCSVVLGIFTIRTGSVKVSILMHIIASAGQCLFTLLEISEGEYVRIYQILLCVIIIAIALTSYIRITRTGSFSFNIGGTKSEMVFSKKIKAIITTGSMVVWVIGVAIMVIAEVRTI